MFLSVLFCHGSSSDGLPPSLLTFQTMLNLLFSWSLRCESLTYLLWWLVYQSSFSLMSFKFPEFNLDVKYFLLKAWKSPFCTWSFFPYNLQNVIRSFPLYLTHELESLSEATALVLLYPTLLFHLCNFIFCYSGKATEKQKYLNITHLKNKEIFFLPMDAIFTTADCSVASISVVARFYHKWQDWRTWDLLGVHCKKQKFNSNSLWELFL